MNEGAREYTPQELMVAVASREIPDHDLVFVGMRLPILAYAVARNNHAPSARGLFEVGLINEVRENTGWSVDVREDVKETSAPTPAELATIRGLQKADGATTAV